MAEGCMGQAGVPVCEPSFRMACPSNDEAAGRIPPSPVHSPLRESRKRIPGSRQGFRIALRTRVPGGSGNPNRTDESRRTFDRERVDRMTPDPLHPSKLVPSEGVSEQMKRVRRQDTSLEMAIRRLSLHAAVDTDCMPRWFLGRSDGSTSCSSGLVSPCSWTVASGMAVRCTGASPNPTRNGGSKRSQPTESGTPIPTKDSLRRAGKCFEYGNMKTRIKPSSASLPPSGRERPNLDIVDPTVPALVHPHEVLKCHRQHWKAPSHA